MTTNILILEALAKAICEWNQPEGSCRCKALAMNDRCPAVAGMAEAIMKKFLVEIK